MIQQLSQASTVLAQISHVEWNSLVSTAMGAILGGGITLHVANKMYKQKISDDRIREIRDACIDFQTDLHPLAIITGRAIANSMHSKTEEDVKNYVIEHLTNHSDQTSRVRMRIAICRTICSHPKILKHLQFGDMLLDDLNVLMAQFPDIPSNEAVWREFREEIDLITPRLFLVSENLAQEIYQLETNPRSWIARIWHRMSTTKTN